MAASLKAFDGACDRVQRGDSTAAPAPTAPAAPPHARDPQVRSLLARVASGFAADAQPVLVEGVRRMLDYQDAPYASLYLDRMAAIAALGDTELTRETARHLALWMSYEDTIRVADLKTRDSRFERVRAEVRVQADQVLAINEYMHPRLQEICDTLPAALGRWLLGSRWPRRVVERFAARGRVVTTSSLRGFVLLYAVAAMRRWRRATLRYEVENARIEAWLDQIQGAAATSMRLAVEIARCQRLVKGYGDTHERGLRNYEALLGSVRRGVSAETLVELRDAALADEHGTALRAALVRHALV